MKILQIEGPDACRCRIRHPVVLQFCYILHPFACSNCNLQLFVSDIEPSLHSRIIQWYDDYKKVYEIWLPSDDDYSPTLSDSKSSINTVGLNIVAEMANSLSVYYWWHVPARELSAFCPNCKNPMQCVYNLYTKQHYTCEECHIIVPQSD